MTISKLGSRPAILERSGSTYRVTAWRKRHTRVRPFMYSNGARRIALFDLAERHDGIVPAEPERVRHGEPNIHLAGLVRDVVEVAVGVRGLVVDRGRHDAAVDGQHARRALDGSRSPEHVPRHRLGGR